MFTIDHLRHGKGNHTLSESGADTSRIRMNVSYNGEKFKGFQIQPDQITVQGELEAALGKFYGNEVVRVNAAGRTDTGVHAVTQVVHFDEPTPRVRKKLEKALSALVSSDILVWRFREVQTDFHSRYSARGRIYRYRILNSPNPFFERFAWFPGYKAAVERLASEASIFSGSYDFSRFSIRPDPDESPICNIEEIAIYEDQLGILLEIKADRFLRRMVRTLVGTLVELATDRMERESVIKALQGDNLRVGVPAPAQGLALYDIHYEINDKLDIPPHSPWSLIR
ncbi:tRNA pseudouridine(38-40) synthase TruA [bacterium]|nr:tRNA pseudouridine(38-40) synthase TruA [bacterium]